MRKEGEKGQKSKGELEKGKVDEDSVSITV